jgi:hypothetical protein
VACRAAMRLPLLSLTRCGQTAVRGWCRCHWAWLMQRLAPLLGWTAVGTEQLHQLTKLHIPSCTAQPLISGSMCSVAAACPSAHLDDKQFVNVL